LISGKKSRKKTSYEAMDQHQSILNLVHLLPISVGRPWKHVFKSSLGQWACLSGVQNTHNTLPNTHAASLQHVNS